MLGIREESRSPRVYEGGGKGGIIRGTVSFSSLVDRFGFEIWFVLTPLLQASSRDASVCHTQGLSSVAVESAELLWNFKL